MIAGGSGSNEARVFERESGNLVGIIRDMAQVIIYIQYMVLESQLAHKIVNLSFTITDMKNKLTDLYRG